MKHGCKCPKRAFCDWKGSLFHSTVVSLEAAETAAKGSSTEETTDYSQIKLNLRHSLVPFSYPSCPFKKKKLSVFWRHIMQRQLAWHYLLLVTDRPAFVPATVQRALTLNSLAGPVSASSGNTRTLCSHEGNLESTADGKPRNGHAILHLTSALSLTALMEGMKLNNTGVLT